MEDFSKSVNEFLSFRRYENKGKISKQLADEKAAAEYTVFNKTQKINSDFDKQIKRLNATENYKIFSERFLRDAKVKIWLEMVGFKE